MFVGQFKGLWKDETVSAIVHPVRKLQRPQQFQIIIIVLPTWLSLLSHHRLAVAVFDQMSDPRKFGHGLSIL